MEARELQLNERNVEKTTKHALATQISKKNHQKKKYMKGGKGKSKKCVDMTESLNKRGVRGEPGKTKERSKGFEKRKVQCCKCEKFGHFGDEYWFGNDKMWPLQ